MNPRTIRLLRASTLPAFHAAVAQLCRHDDLAHIRDTAVLVPSRSAASQLRRTLERLAFQEGGETRVVAMPELLTRDDWYQRLQARLPLAAPLLSSLEREVLLGAAARAAIEAGAVPPFRMRPALVGEMLAFFDALARQQRTVDDFERLMVGELEPRAEYDRGAERLLRQTRFLVAAFREFEARLSTLPALDEHRLRARLLASAPRWPFRHIVVTVGDRASDPAGGLFPADWDLLTRLPGVDLVHIVSTTAMLNSGLEERLEGLLPGLEREEAEPVPRAPVLAVPPGDGTRLFTSRDREEELRDIARRIKADAREEEARGATPALDRVGLVFKRPLPYVYLARTVFGSAGIEYQVADALPLAAEPYAAALSLVFDAVGSRFTRPSLIALLRSPHFTFTAPAESAEEAQDRPTESLDSSTDTVTTRSVSALDAALAEAGYLGDPSRLLALASEIAGDARPAARAAAAAASQLAPLLTPAPVTMHLVALGAFVRDHEAPPTGDEATVARHLRARGAILSALDALREAAARYDDPTVAFADVAATIRRFIESQTFSPRHGAAGIQFVDARAARYGDFDSVHLAGLVEGEWPEGQSASIFYPSFLLSQLGWPPPTARTAAERSAFADLLRLPATTVSVSAFTLEDDSLVEPSSLLDELDRSGLAVVQRQPDGRRVFLDEALTSRPVGPMAVGGTMCEWAELRQSRTDAASPIFHGTAQPAGARAYSITSIDRYLDCPFKYFAVSVLRLPEETTEEEGMTPLERGRFVHELFHAFFTEWQAGGHAAITVANLPAARALFAEVAERKLATLSPGDAALERVRVLGSVAAPGLGEIALTVEASHPEPIRERLLEFPFDGEYLIDGGNGPRRVRLRGVVDRADLLADGRLRIIDYKIGRAPEPKRTIQLPIYLVCLQQFLKRTRGAEWTPGEAYYLAFGESDAEKTVIGPKSDLTEVLTREQGRLLEVIDGIEHGHFPPKPSAPRRCGTCAYVDVCRKDYASAD